jgi:hypothetical protein
MFEWICFKPKKKKKKKEEAYFLLGGVVITLALVLHTARADRDGRGENILSRSYIH